MSSRNKLQFRSLINHSPKEIFGWHLRPRRLERAIPPWESMQVIDSKGRADKIGSKVEVCSRLFGIVKVCMKMEYIEFTKNERFTVVSRNGTTESYRYETIITPQNDHSVEMIDSFQYSFSFPSFLKSLFEKVIKKRMHRILKYKHDIMDHDLAMVEKYPFERPLKVLITGGHGLIGKNLGYFLEFMGHDVWQLSRKGMGEEKKIYWNPQTGKCNPENFEGFDCMVHLAGENIGEGRWTRRKKERLFNSRVKGTEHLVQIIKGLRNPPKVFIGASAVGYYGDRGREVVNETSGPGQGLFITELCEEWERATRDLEEKGIRVVNARFGIVLTAKGGALKRMLTPFKWGMGGKIGNGHQYMSWIAIDDVIGALYHIIMTPKIEGAVNVVSPNPVSNDVFTKKLSERLNRWKGPPFPEFLVHLFLGQKGEELLLTSTRVEPARLSETGYHFQYPKLYQALEHVV